MSSTRRIALIFGVLYLATFVFSIVGLLLYSPVLHPPKFMAGAGGDTRVRLGLVCEVLLIIANVGTAVVIFPILRRQNEILSLGYVAARLVEATFIAIGIVCLLAVVTLRHDGGVSLLTGAKSLVAVRNWTFVIGPGFFSGFGNGLILGYLMYRSGLMPRGLAIVGLIGGTLICITGLGVVLNVFNKGGTAQTIATVPEFIWELSLGIYPIVKGFKASPILAASLPSPGVTS
ncbi:MAG: DUF4386 domain-containing protein [Solirubrobacterales bacterium]|nr:DUF4386 domain-containing protein [Solirubrobacterales bacterium]MBV9534772.1 DUF4386 domain-containing protein [Solirubrobacterales bacterium]